MEHCEARADLLGETEQVQFHSQPTVITFLGLLEAVQVGFEICLAEPGRAVDALQHGVLFAAPEVGAGHPLECEMAELSGAGHMRTAAHVNKALAVAVEADHAVGRIRFGDRFGIGVDCLADLASPRCQVHEHPFVGMVRHQFPGIVNR